MLYGFKVVNAAKAWKFIIRCSHKQFKWLDVAMAETCNAGVHPLHWEVTNKKPTLCHSGLTNVIEYMYVGYYIDESSMLYLHYISTPHLIVTYFYSFKSGLFYYRCG
jgi:hypothetical protein